MQIALDILFPPRCVACKTHLKNDGEVLCAECLRRVPLHGRPVPFPRADYTLIAATSYASREVQALVKSLKYDGVGKAASTMALITVAAARDVLEREVLTPAHPVGGREEWIITPVPLHPKRERERGFNQSMLFAESLSHHHPFAGFPIVSALRRVRHTDTQTEKPDYKARAVNVSGCFETTHHANVRGKNVLLIDDVTTSGATLTEAARALKHAGAKHIIALVFAKA